MDLTGIAISTVLVTSLATAVWIDGRQRRIPNWLSAAVAVMGILIHTLGEGPAGTGYALVGLLVGFVIFLLPYAMGGMAAGDVKLMAGVGACLGPGLTILAACAALVAGSALGLALMTYHYYRAAAVTPRDALGLRFPYASAIGIGSMAALIMGSRTWMI